MNGAINMLVEKINNILCIRFLNGRNMAYIKGLPSQLSCFYERKKILGQFYSSVAKIHLRRPFRFFELWLHIFV